MRPILALLLSLSVLGGVFSYVRFANRVRRPAAELNIEYADGEFEVEISKSFANGYDSILGTESMAVLFKGKMIFGTKRDLPADEVIRFTIDHGVEAGENEIFLKAFRGNEPTSLDAVKVVVKRNGFPISQQVLVNEPGLATIAGPIVFEISSTDQDHHDDH